LWTFILLLELTVNLWASLDRSFGLSSVKDCLFWLPCRSFQSPRVTIQTPSVFLQGGSTSPPLHLPGCFPPVLLTFPAFSTKPFLRLQQFFPGSPVLVPPPIFSRIAVAPFRSKFLRTSFLSDSFSNAPPVLCTWRISVAFLPLNSRICF